MKYIMSLRQGLEKMIKEHSGYLIGEDIQEPYGGAFKVTKGMSNIYPDNIIGTPMCEQGFTGLGVGMSLHGEYVSVEIMFGDFITLIADQLINHAAKFSDMYHQDMHLVVRCPSGGYRGYGATHSQSLEKLFMGVPGLQVIAPSIAVDPGELFNRSLDSGIPTLFVENKLDYPKEILGEKGDFWCKKVSDDYFPNVSFCAEGEEPDITLITYGGMVTLSLEVMKHFLYEEEINVEVLVLSELSNLHNKFESIQTGTAVVLEEGVAEFGWGSEVCYELIRKGIKAERVGARRRSIPSAKKAEESILPMFDDIVKAVERSLQ